MQGEENMTASIDVSSEEYILMIVVHLFSKEVETHFVITENTPREIAAAHHQRSEVERVLIFDDGSIDTIYPVLFDSANDLNRYVRTENTR